MSSNSQAPIGGKHASWEKVQEGKHLTFHLDQKEFGIGILDKVKEIIGLIPFIPVPHSPSFV